MKNGKGKKWLAILLAAIIALPLLPLQAVFAEEPAAVSEPAPVEEKPKEEKKEEQKEEKQEAPAPEPKEEARQEAVVEEVPKLTPVPEPEKEEEKPAEPAATPEPKPEATPAPEAPPAEETQPQETESAPATEAPATEAPATDAPATEAPEAETTPNPEQSIAPEISMEPVESAEPTPTPIPLPPSFKMLSRSKSHSNNYLDAGSLSIPEKGMPIPLIYQSSYGRAVCEISGKSKSAASSGCGAAAASMIIAYAGDYDQTPYSLFYWAAKNGRYRGDGLDYYTVREMLTRYGIDSRMVGVSAENIISALEKNQPIIINMGPGTFTSDGHYIVLRGLDENGDVLVNDPASSSRSGKAYSVNRICREAKRGEMLVAYAEPAGLEPAPPLEELPEEEIEEPEAEATAEVEDEAEMLDLQVAVVEDLVPEAETPAEIPAEAEMPAEDEVPVAVDIPLEPEVQPAATPAAQLEPYWVEVSVDSANLRDAAGRKGKVSATVSLGTRLQVVEEKTMNSGAVWCGVAYNGQVMYLRSDMLLPIDPAIVEEPVEVKFQPYEAQIIRDNVNLRDDAGLDGAIIATVPLGTPVQVCGQKSGADGSDWFAVVYEEQTLYVRSDMIAAQN